MFEAVGDGPRLGSSQPPNRTRCCTTLKQQAAIFKPVGDGAEAAEAVDGVGAG
jgi:hypothetical protein